jgi:hypothetical protein
MPAAPGDGATSQHREALLAEVCTIGLALSRLADRDQLILMERYDADRGLTDRELATALHCDCEGAREAHAPALQALGGQLGRWA